jgi:hypothetical protein
MYKIPETKFKYYPAIHDVLYDVFNIHYSNDEIDDMVMKLPIDVQWTGIQWGWSDTVFRDNAYEFWMQQRNETQTQKV